MPGMSSAAARSRPDSANTRDHAERKRAEKRAAAEAIGLDAGYIDALVETFYGQIREDALLGPIFAQRVVDWPAHLARMIADSLLTGIETQRSGLSGARAGETLPRV